MEAVDALKSVLCGPDGKCCIAGSQADRDTVDTALAAIQHYLDQRKAELEADRENTIAIGKIALDEATALRAQLEAIAATEPVARAVADKTNTGFVYVRVLADELLFGTKLFARPMPAQGVETSMIKLLDEDLALRAELADMAVNTATYEHLVDLANDTATRLLKERDTLRAQLADAELHTKQVERGLDKATAQLAAIAATEPVDVVLTFNYGQLVKAHIADHTLYEVDLSPKPYFQVCWAHGWAGIYSSEDEAAEDCLSLCGHGRSIREIKPGDDGYRNPNAINFIEQRFPVSQLFTHPMPAQDVTELVEALQLFAYALPLDKSTIKTCYAVTDQMRDAAHAALSKYKGAK